MRARRYDVHGVVALRRRGRGRALRCRGGGRTWPGGGDLPPVFGPKSETSDASERLLDFLEERPM
ncbi:hypothetical protein [Sorangium sp. So ce176]|uniref:hypothetical protein n=1 Tax=Sorangium sp. So ce176 TaxID=3133286 RepID=UPI003F617946